MTTQQLLRKLIPHRQLDQPGLTVSAIGDGEVGLIENGGGSH
jgi:hypothetical protein